jgi:hypothetical protein
LYACATTATTFTSNASTTSRVNSASTSSVRGLLIADELQAAIGTSTARASTLSASRAWSSLAIALIEDNRTLYWVGGNGTWDASSNTNWSNTSGGSSGVVAPSTVDNIIVDMNSSGFFGTNITLSGSPVCKNLTVSQQSTFSSNGTLTINGDFTLSSNTTWSASNTLTFIGNSSISTSGVSIASPIAFNGASQTFTLSQNLTSSNTTTLTAGTLSLSTNKLTSNTFSTTGTSTRSISFGSGSAIDLTGSGTTIWNGTTATGFSTSGTPTINLTYSGSTGTRTIVHGTTGGSITTAALDFNITAGSDTIATTTGTELEDLNFTGFTGTYAPPSALTLYGSLTAVSEMTWTTGTGRITFASTSTGKTVTAAGKTLSQLTFNGVGGGWTLQDNLTLTGTVTLTAGTLTTNNNNVTAENFSSSGSGVRTLNLGSSTITLSLSTTPWNALSSTNFTLNAGTSQINLTTTSDPDFNGGGLTYYNLNAANGQELTITGNNTFNTISCGTTTGAGTTTLTLTGTTQTVNTFSFDGSSLTNYVVLTGGTLSKSSGTVNLNYAYIGTAATGGATWNALAGCSKRSTNATGWNFTSLNRYLVGSGNVGFTTTGRWSTTSGGSAIAQPPYIFDTTYLDANSGNVTVDMNGADLGTLNATAFTGTLDGTSSLDTNGDFLLGNSHTWTIDSGFDLNLNNYPDDATKTVVIDFKNKTLSNGLRFNGTANTPFSMQSNISCQYCLFTGGILNTNNYNFTATLNSSASATLSDGSIPTTFNLGTSTFRIGGSTLSLATHVWNSQNAILEAALSTTSRSFNFGLASTWKEVKIVNPTATGVVTFSSNITTNKLTIDKTIAYTARISGTVSVGQLVVPGTSGAMITFSSTGTGTLASLGGVKQSGINYVTIDTNTVNLSPAPSETQPYVWYLGENSVNNTAREGLLTSDTSWTYYRLLTGTSWSVPNDWNSSNNEVYLIGGGGGGSGSIVTGSTGTHVSGSGGGGGGFTKLTNVTLTANGTVSYAIGAAGSAGSGSASASTGGNAGNTTFNITDVAYGGGGARANTTAAIPGSAGTGTTNNGGSGGTGTVAGNVSNAGAGGGGSGGTDGAGVNGGNNSSTTIGSGGAGNNNVSDYVLVGIISYGDGGNGGTTTSAGVAGSVYGGGGGGGGTAASSATVRAGGIGTQGAILIRYALSTGSSNFFQMFYP